MVASAGVAGANSPPANPACDITGYSYTVNGSPGVIITNAGSPDIMNSVTGGSHVVVTFTVPAGCNDQISLASYRAPSNAFDPSTANQQVLFGSDTGTFGPGVHTLSVDVFGSSGSGGNPADCSVSHNSNTGKGANTSGPYNSTCNGSPSLNGNGNGNANGKPCAGCVGNADDKNPPGQMPNGGDPNAGYECDRNNGVGKTNPAHTGCTNFQVDFAYGPVLQQLSAGGPLYNDNGGLIAYANG